MKHLSDLMEEIHDTLLDTTLAKAYVEIVAHDRRHIRAGVYIHYWTGEHDPIDRCVYLGRTSDKVKDIERKFYQWVGNWMIQ